MKLLVNNFYHVVFLKATIISMRLFFLNCCVELIHLLIQAFHYKSLSIHTPWISDGEILVLKMVSDSHVHINNILITLTFFFLIKNMMQKFYMQSLNFFHSDWKRIATSVGNTHFSYLTSHFNVLKQKEVMESYN